MKLNKTSGYILAIVGIVAVVGIIIMIINNVGSSSNISGQAIGTKTRLLKCSDTDGGENFVSEGTVSGGMWASNSSYSDPMTDNCYGEERLTEFYCNKDGIHLEVDFIYCDSIDSRYTCHDGKCGVYLH
jgi:hypothetical protein